MGASESKLGFKQGIFRLAEEDNIPPTDPLWAKFYQLPETADDVLALWSPNDLHALTLTRPDDRPLPNTQVHPRKNLETLVYTCISRLHHLQALSANAEQQRSSSLEALNCIRMLTRAFPYIYEAEHISQWEHRFFWKPQTPQQVWDKRNNRPGSWVDGLNPQADLDLTSDGPSEEHASEKVLDPPLGEQLIDILVRYLFWPGFTLPKKQSTDGSSEQRADFRIWNSGIGCRYSAGMTKENEKNAVEVLRLLLSLCSRQMYIPPHAVSAADVRPLVYITTKTDRQIVLTLICSLLNTILKYNPASWIVPLEWSSDGDPRTRLVHTSLQFLLVLLLYSEPSGETNQFRKAMGRLHRAEDFQFIQQGITMVLTQPVSGINIPGMQRECPWAGEALSLFWELLQVNKRFQLFIIETDRVHDFVVMVLYYAMAYKDEPAKQGLIRMCALILQTLSVDSSFGKRLNKVFVGQDSLPASVKINHFHGSYADFLVTTIHTLMTTTKGRLDSIYPTFLAIIYNVSPYVKDLQRATSSKILDLFIQLSNPKFLLEKETNYTLLVTLLQAISTTLAWQSESNRRLVDVVARNRMRFKALQNLTIEGDFIELDGTRHGKSPAAGSPLVSGEGSNRRENHPPNSPRQDEPFAVGDDDDDDDEEDTNSNMAASTSQGSDTPGESSTATPLRRMSEKARGKLPAGSGQLSRVTSRSASITSMTSAMTGTALPASISSTGPQVPFRPTSAWLEEWLPLLPLRQIFASIDRATESRNDAGCALPDPETPRVQAFTWSPSSRGWYISLLWGLIYASDIATNKGINGIWSGTNVKLFSVIASTSQGSVSLKSPKGAVDYVGDSIAERISNLRFSSGSGGGV